MIHLAALVSATVFIVALRAMRIVAVATRALDVTRAAGGALRNAALDDAEKERRMQVASLALMGTFVAITARAIVATGAAGLSLLLFQVAGLADLTAVARLLATWQGIVLTSAVMTTACFVKVRA